MKTRQQAAREYADKACDTTPRKNDGYPLTRTIGELKDDAIQDFLAGCEHVDKEHRDFYLLVREYFKEDVWREAKEHSAIFTKIEKHLVAFNEREQTSLPFKD